MWFTLSKIKYLGLTILLCGLLSGCALPVDLSSLIPDSGTNITVSLDSTAYLDTSLLDSAETVSSYAAYDTYTIAYGTFSTSVSSVRASVVMLETTQVSVPDTNGTMYMVEMVVERNDYVRVGDVIAYVKTEMDDLDLAELELKLTRLEERYAAVQEARAEALEEEATALYAVGYKTTSYEVMVLEQKATALAYEKTCASYEAQIAAVEEQIAAFKEAESISQIVAEVEGYVLEVNYKSSGTKLSTGDVLANIAPSDKICLQFDDTLLHYGYGCELTVIVGNSRIPTANANTINGTQYSAVVISPSGKILGADWDKGYAQLIGDYDMEQIVGAGAVYISGTTNVVENVLLLPADAVTVESSGTYVTILWEDEGRLEKREFLAGGNNTSTYWVLEGLEEGMTVILQ